MNSYVNMGVGAFLGTVFVLMSVSIASEGIFHSEAPEKEGFTNIQPILGSGSDPRLPKNAVDLILLVDVYHEFAQPQRMLRRMREALKPDGRLIMLEYRKEDPHIPIRSEHKMSVEEARLEVEAEGYKLERVLQDLPRQHIFVFRKNTM